MGNTEQLDNIAQKVDAVGRQVEDISETVNDMWAAQQGDDVVGAKGLMRRVEELEKQAESFAKQEDVDDVKDDVGELTSQQQVWETQIRFMSVAAGGGGLGGIAALIWTLIQAFSRWQP